MSDIWIRFLIHHISLGPRPFKIDFHEEIPV